MNIAAVSEILGIQPPASELDLIDQIRQGLPGVAAERIAASLGLSLRGLSVCVRLSPDRLRGRFLEADASEKLVAVAEVVAASRQVLGEVYDDWLTAKMETLWDKRPIDFLDTAVGCRLILGLLRNVEYDE